MRKPEKRKKYIVRRFGEAVFASESCLAAREWLRLENSVWPESKLFEVTTLYPDGFFESHGSDLGEEDRSDG